MYNRDQVLVRTRFDDMLFRRACFALFSLSILTLARLSLNIINNFMMSLLIVIAITSTSILFSYSKGDNIRNLTVVLLAVILESYWLYRQQVRLSLSGIPSIIAELTLFFISLGIIYFELNYSNPMNKTTKTVLIIISQFIWSIAGENVLEQLSDMDAMIRNLVFSLSTFFFFVPQHIRLIRCEFGEGLLLITLLRNNPYLAIALSLTGIIFISIMRKGEGENIKTYKNMNM